MVTYRNLSLLVTIIGILCINTSCKKKTGSKADRGKPIAEYLGKSLYEKDLNFMLDYEISASDSLSLTSNYIDRWLKEEVLLAEASKNVSYHTEIEELTNNYRNSLLLHYYENKLLNEKLDTVVQDAEVSQYYESNKAEYKLESTILRCLFLKIRKPIEDQDQLNTWWKTPNGTNLQFLNKYCQNNAEKCYLQSEKWFKWSDIQNDLPTKYLIESTLWPGLIKEFADFKYHYFIRIFEVVRPNQDPPFSFVKEKATMEILYKRKQKFIQEYKNQLYERELKNKTIKIHTR
ncbi:MAG: peptidylprolyl isomerase [Bacteroidota bacterium]|nr:peptidylprolyl isomerase [Bacteroidota bacterium]